MKTYHILNGDALLQQLPDSVSGERIVAREALVDGPVKAETLEELYQIRDQFISTRYPGYVAGEYFDKTVPEFNNILEIPPGSEINLWFEDDLFCQVNFWFVCHLLSKSEYSHSVYLVRPPVHSQYGFGGFQPDTLPELLNNKIQVDREIIQLLADLWKAYQYDDLKSMNELAQQLHSFPFVRNAVEAHIDRVENNTPVKILKQIIEELKTEEFGPVFREFCKRTPHYGFGDLQVKYLFDQLLPEI